MLQALNKIDINLISSMMDFSSPWLYFSSVLTVISFITSLIFSRVHRTTYDAESMIVIQILFFIPLIVSFCIFIVAVRKNPIFDFGFDWSILIPTIYFYILVLVLLRKIYLVFKFTIFQIKGSYAARAIVVILSQIKVSIALAYSSPTGILIALADTIFAFLIFACWKTQTGKAHQD